MSNVYGFQEKRIANSRIDGDNVVTVDGVELVKLECVDIAGDSVVLYFTPEQMMEAVNLQIDLARRAMMRRVTKENHERMGIADAGHERPGTVVDVRDGDSVHGVDGLALHRRNQKAGRKVRKALRARDGFRR